MNRGRRLAVPRARRPTRRRPGRDGNEGAQALTDSALLREEGLKGLRGPPLVWLHNQVDLCGVGTLRAYDYDSNRALWDRQFNGGFQLRRRY